MTAAEARELLAACKRQRDVWRIAGMPPSPEAVARVERDEAAAREVLAAELSAWTMGCAACSGCGLVWRTEPQSHAVPCEVCGAKGRVPAAPRADYDREHAARVAAEAEADGLRRDLAAVARDRDLYRAALADAARGEAARCDTHYGGTLATQVYEDGDGACDACAKGDGWTDTPHAAAIRGALKATGGER